MIRTLDNPFYYLDNFHRVTAWIADRYGDLLDAGEQAFIASFNALPQSSRALLVRMVMRKGELFRASKLRYEEIGCTREAAQPLVELGWVDDRPLLTLEQAFGLLTKSEIAEAFRDALPKAAARKAEQLDALRDAFLGPRCFDGWTASGDCVYRIEVTALCDRLRLMFFGNLRQDWTEFVLSDLGIYRYESVEFSASSRGFRSREDVDVYLHLHRCRERFEEGEAPDDILKALPDVLENDWLEGRRARLLFQVAQHQERMGALPEALRLYSACSHPGARVRAIRVLERSEDVGSAHALAQEAAQNPESEEERQHLLRILPRLHRKLGLPKIPACVAPPVERMNLTLPIPEPFHSVEETVRAHLSQDDAPVYYVENTLINSLFGLLCWKAIFTAVPGAFFHPFHIGPADLHSADFHRRREAEFAECLAQLDSGEYLRTINRNFEDKAGILSPFVFWEVLSEELKDIALACIPASHLKTCFERILLDIRANRAGFPDLIQFRPDEMRYRMIEVKGPGDRLQDNQVRWLEHFCEHGLPVAVCYVQWAEDGA